MLGYLYKCIFMCIRMEGVEMILDFCTPLSEPISFYKKWYI
jgi:hypothetical protein